MSSSIWLSSRSCRVLWGQRPPGVSMVRITDLGAAGAGLCCDALDLWVAVLHCPGAETGLKISNNSTREKSNLEKSKTCFVLFFCFALLLLWFHWGFFFFPLSTDCFKGWIDTGYIYDTETEWSPVERQSFKWACYCGFIVAEERTQKACQLHYVPSKLSRNGASWGTGITNTRGYKATST